MDLTFEDAMEDIEALVGIIPKDSDNSDMESENEGEQSDKATSPGINKSDGCSDEKDFSTDSGENEAKNDQSSSKPDDSKLFKDTIENIEAVEELREKLTSVIDACSRVKSGRAGTILKSTKSSHSNNNIVLGKNKPRVEGLVAKEDFAIFYDCTIVCGNKRFPCHRIILALKSTVFKAMLDGGVKWLVIEDLVPDIVEVMIENIYTGEVPVNIKKIAPELMHAAKKYNIKGLVKACEESLMEELSPNNATSTLIIADRFSFRQDVLDYMKENIQMVVKSDNWKTFIREYPDLVTDVVLNNVKGDRPAKKAKWTMAAV